MALVNARSVSNKTFILNDFFTSRGLDFLFLTETWTGADESSIFGELCPLNFSFISTPRCVRRGGGVALVFRNQYKIQTIFFAENFSTFESQCVSSIQTIINFCLVSGTVPAFLKHAVVHPLLKKPNVDVKCLNNYRPISKLPFFSKVMEKVVQSQLLLFLNSTMIFEPFQSGFATYHSTETALLKVMNDLLLAVDSGENAVLILLDLSAAFDTVDHDILLSHLEHWVGIKDTALSWFKSYLKSRTLSVAIGQFSSSSVSLPYEVPQGSILGPLVFNLYMLPLGNIIRKY